MRRQSSKELKALEVSVSGSGGTVSGSASFATISAALPHLPPFGAGFFREFRTNETFDIPDNVTAIRVRVTGAPGKGSDPANQTPADGGTASFGALISATGGESANGETGGLGGQGVGGDFQAKGGRGGNAHAVFNEPASGGGGGSGSFLGDGGNGGNGLSSTDNSPSGGGGGVNQCDGGDAVGTASGGGAGTSSSAVGSKGGNGIPFDASIVERFAGETYYGTGTDGVVTSSPLPVTGYGAEGGASGVGGDGGGIAGGTGGVSGYPAGFGGGGGGGGGYAHGEFTVVPGTSYSITVPSGAQVIVEF